MNHILTITLATMLITTATTLAWQMPVGPAPAPAFADMERSTNAIVQAETIQRCRVFECSLSLILHLSADGAPRTLLLSADCTNNAFSAIIDSPPDWMFSREWDAIRLTVRGGCDSAESASVRFGPNPAFIILR